MVVFVDWWISRRGYDSREREKSNKLHAEMDGYLRTAAVELYTAYNMVNHALATRVQETTDVKNKLQERLARV